MPVQYWEQAPPHALARELECAWFAEADGTTRARVVPPDGCMDLIHYGHCVHLVGAMTVPLVVEEASPIRLQGLRFHSGWLAALMGINAGQFTDLAFDLSEVDAGLAKELMPAFERGIAHVFSVLAKRAANSSDRKASLRALDWARIRGSDVKVDWLADQCGLSERQFRRQVIEQTGLAPKLLLRVWRFRRAQRLAGQMRWAEVAAQCGYADQAHLIREWREFTGRTPSMSDFFNPDGVVDR